MFWRHCSAVKPSVKSLRVDDVLFRIETPQVIVVVPVDTPPKARSLVLVVPKLYAPPVVGVPSLKKNNAFAPDPPDLKICHPSNPFAIIGAAPSWNGPDPDNVKVPLDGKPSKLWA